MGGNQSAPLDLPLCPPPEAICATEPRFCLPHTVQLLLCENSRSFSGVDFNIMDPYTGVVYFQCHGKSFSLRDRKVLCDNMGQPILNLQEQILSISNNFRVYAGDNSAREICQLNSQPSLFSAKLSAHFTDLLNRRSRYIVLKGDLRENCMIFRGDPKRGGVPIAKICRAQTGRSFMFGADEYVIEIVAGVDIALMVIMCVAFNELKRDNLPFM